MNKIQSICLILTLLLVCLLGFALKLIQVEPLNTTTLRLFVLSGVLLLTIMALLASTKLPSRRQKLLLVCVVCLITVVPMTICESLIKRIKADSQSIHGSGKGKFQTVEVYLLIFYYIIYYGGSVLFFVSAFFVTIWSLIDGPQHYLSDKNLEEIYKDSICPICLAQMDDRDQHYVQINNCKHIFHRDCLVEWMSHKNTCPLCRQDIYEREDGRWRGDYQY